MNKLFATLLATSLLALMAAPAALAVDTRISAKCGPDAPEAYKRPGGFCEQIGSNQSQASEAVEREWWWDLPALR